MNDFGFNSVEEVGLGKLTVLTLHIWYDGPMIYSCTNDEGQIFLASCFDADDKYYRYLYRPLTAAELKDVEESRITLYDLFKTAETVYEVGHDYCKTRSGSELSDDELAVPGTYLSP